MLEGRIRRSWLGMVLGSCVFLQPMSGVAAPTAEWFSDDFETGTLSADETPAGRWDRLVIFGTSTVTSRVEGAHRGQYGLTVLDRSSNAGSHASANVERDPLSSEFFVRTWLRLRDVNASGSLVAMQVLPAKVELRLHTSASGTVWELAARTGTNQSYVSLHGSRVEAERWYLVEFSARGLGTPGGEARLWVDGVEQGAVSGSDWRDLIYVLNMLVVGEPWSDTGTYLGALDFDDVRVSATPVASRLGLRRPGDTGSSPGCIPVDVSLRNSGNGALAPAPYETEVALSVTVGMGGFHADAACKSPMVRVLLPTGISERRVYFRPGGSSGLATLAVSHPDFLSATLEVEGVGVPDEDPDEGDPDASGPWTMDLGCASAPGAFVALPVLLGPWLRRARRWRTRTGSCPVD